MVNSLLDEMRPVIRGLDAVRVTKEDLLEIIRGNRKEHREIFEEAIDNWYKKVVVTLEEMVKTAKEGPEKVILAIHLPRPEDHTTDYDRVIKMLEMSLDNEFELSENEFAQYVMDDWGWQRTFLASSSMYSRRAVEKQGKMG